MCPSFHEFECCFPYDKIGFKVSITETTYFYRTRLKILLVKKQAFTACPASFLRNSYVLPLIIIIIIFDGSTDEFLRNDARQAVKACFYEQNFKSSAVKICSLGDAYFKTDFSI